MKQTLLSSLSRFQIRPRKHLSQNFLIDANVVDKVIRCAEITPGDHVLEIGPGTGALTSKLLAEGAIVTAIEKDPFLCQTLAPHPRLTVLNQDVLDVAFDSLGENLKIVSNVPYHITSLILEKIFQESAHFSTMTLILQKEVKERLLAKPRTKAYGSLSLFFQYHANFLRAFDISPSCFYPAPQVVSSVLHASIKTFLPLKDSSSFFMFVRQAFQQRRKMLKVSLKKHFSSSAILQVLENLSLSPHTRAEELSMDAWLLFFSQIASESPKTAMSV